MIQSMLKRCYGRRVTVRGVHLDKLVWWLRLAFMFFCSPGWQPRYLTSTPFDKERHMGPRLRALRNVAALSRAIQREARSL